MFVIFRPIATRDDDMCTRLYPIRLKKYSAIAHISKVVPKFSFLIQFFIISFQLIWLNSSEIVLYGRLNTEKESFDLKYKHLHCRVLLSMHKLAANCLNNLQQTCGYQLAASLHFLNLHQHWCVHQTCCKLFYQTCQNLISTNAQTWCKLMK
jgi:hypothetical protein